MIIGLIGLFFLLLTFNLGGGETLSQVENQNIAQLIISIFLLIIAVFSARRYIKNNRRYTAYGIIISPLILIVIATIYLFEHNVYHTKFDKTIWEQSEWKPESMAKTLVKEKVLIGMTRAQVKEMLGEGSKEYGNASSDRGSILYQVKNDWTLIVLFQKDKVVETELRLPYLGV